MFANWSRSGDGRIEGVVIEKAGIVCPVARVFDSQSQNSINEVTLEALPLVADVSSSSGQAVVVTEKNVVAWDVRSGSDCLSVNRSQEGFQGIPVGRVFFSKSGERIIESVQNPFPISGSVDVVHVRSADDLSIIQSYSGASVLPNSIGDLHFAMKRQTDKNNEFMIDVVEWSSLKVIDSVRTISSPMNAPWHCFAISPDSKLLAFQEDLDKGSVGLKGVKCALQVMEIGKSSETRSYISRPSVDLALSAVTGLLCIEDNFGCSYEKSIENEQSRFNKEIPGQVDVRGVVEPSDDDPAIGVVRNSRLIFSRLRSDEYLASFDLPIFDRPLNNLFPTIPLAQPVITKQPGHNRWMTFSGDVLSQFEGRSICDHSL